MNKALNLLTKRLSSLQLAASEFHGGPSSSVITPSVYRIPPPPSSSKSEPQHIPTRHRILPLDCPTLHPQKVFSLPSLLNAVPQVAPPPLSHLPEKVDPGSSRPEIRDPLKRAPMLAGPRALKIRRHKMRKHKRNKRFQRDWFKYQKYHREKKLKAEKAFVARMKAHLAELQAFDPEKYVEDTIRRAKREWSDELAPTGRRLYPHWSRLMSLEELYGLPPSEYIDKRAGYPTEEDAAKIKALKERYKREFLGVLPELEAKKSDGQS